MSSIRSCPGHLQGILTFLLRKDATFAHATTPPCLHPLAFRSAVKAEQKRRWSCLPSLSPRISCLPGFATFSVIQGALQWRETKLFKEVIKRYHISQANKRIVSIKGLLPRKKNLRPRSNTPYTQKRSKRSNLSLSSCNWRKERIVNADYLERDLVVNPSLTTIDVLMRAFRNLTSSSK